MGILSPINDFIGGIKDPINDILNPIKDLGNEVLDIVKTPLEMWKTMMDAMTGLINSPMLIVIIIIVAMVGMQFLNKKT